MCMCWRGCFLPVKKVEMQVPVAVFDREWQRILTKLPSVEGLRLLVNAPEEVKADRDFMMAAVRKYGYSIEFASEELRSDRELVMTAVSRAGANLEHASEGLRSDRDFMMDCSVKEWGCSPICLRRVEVRPQPSDDCSITAWVCSEVCLRSAEVRPQTRDDCSITIWG